MRNILLLPLLLFSFTLTAQTEDMKEAPLPYYQIPDAPDEYNAYTVAARTLDGLGFRYYWATEGLREEDLEYRPSETSRSCMETLEHIHDLSSMVLNAILQQPNTASSEREVLSYEQLRQQTLEQIKRASDLLKSDTPADIAQMDIVFKRGDQQTAFPFWNVLNGPLADALWHTGQVVSFRRASGNPFNPRVSVLRGSVRE